MMTTRAPKQIAVYRAKTPSNAQPDCYIDAPEATRVIRNGDAKRINHGKAIRLRPNLKVIHAGSVECRPRFAESGVV